MGLLLSLLPLPLNERVVADPRRVGGGSRTRSKYLRRGVTAVTILVPYSYAIQATYELGTVGATVLACTLNSSVFSVSTGSSVENAKTLILAR